MSHCLEVDTCHTVIRWILVTLSRGGYLSHYLEDKLYSVSAYYIIVTIGHCHTISMS